MSNNTVELTWPCTWQPAPEFETLLSGILTQGEGESIERALDPCLQTCLVRELGAGLNDSREVLGCCRKHDVCVAWPRR